VREKREGDSKEEREVKTSEYYDDLIRRAELMMYEAPIIGELMNAVRELKERPEVVRCGECKWFMPKHILLDDGMRRAYTEEERKLPLGVTGDVGINCGSSCMRHLYWEENRIPVWFQENDFCSYGERRSNDEHKL